MAEEEMPLECRPNCGVCRQWGARPRPETLIAEAAQRTPLEDVFNMLGKPVEAHVPTKAVARKVKFDRDVEKWKEEELRMPGPTSPEYGPRMAEWNRERSRLQRIFDLSTNWVCDSCGQQVHPADHIEKGELATSFYYRCPETKNEATLPEGWNEE